MIPPRDLEHARRRALRAVGRVLGIARWPPVPVRWNRRLRRAGRALLSGPGRPPDAARVELSPAYFQVYPEDLAGILVHEMVHVGLALLGRHPGHGAVFRRTCREAGGLVHARALPGRRYRYRCPVCGASVERRRRVARDRWCARCADEAARRGEEDPFASARRLVLVEVLFAPPEPRPPAS